MTAAPARVVVGLSGGVDSSVSAWLLKEQGYEVIGLFMKNWEDAPNEPCRSREDLVDAVAVAEVLGIEIEAVNFTREYQERVFQHFLREYRAGRTPNPDVLCNSEIKFKSFLEHALALGATQIATGHYARLQREGDTTAPAGYSAPPPQPELRRVAGSAAPAEAAAPTLQLLRGSDPGKDQSYFLYRLQPHQLAPSMFPVGGLLKSEVRALARKAGLPTAAKKDSTGICFIGERPFREFLQRYLPRQPGPMETPEGRRVGTHQGLMYYTLGQRQGLEIGGAGAPWYVAGKDLEHNRLIVVQGHEHPALYRREVVVEDLSWIAGSAPPAMDQLELSAKNRYRQGDAPCRARWLDPGHRLLLSFAQAQWAVTPGQSAVLYSGERCLGGGIISATQPEEPPA